ncbi:retinol dehydrogenase 12-like [Anneissia japonica]|uniref:retinol dehydrogenase 12-like n=1 Tax=Anneissia japonica TaxID=1529436 RepID=UPI001425917D|nr:retinol dehydrogenase 12-like [Anneissia japonica]XP_033125905.1 retinol dehydrogenase 12-like [Anneissia japonica]
MIEPNETIINGNSDNYQNDTTATIVATMGICFALLALLKYYLVGGVCKSNCDMTNKIVIITGANSGIGKATALDLARRNARVILACRDVTKGKRAMEEIKSKTRNGQLIVKSLDLGSFKSIRRFCKEINKEFTQLDVLINNAGIFFHPFSKTEDGFESHFGVNHLGHFLLTNLLLDLLKQSAPSRIVIVSSLVHAFSSIDFNNLNSEKGYNRMTAYNRSKLANVYLANELRERLQDSGVTVCSLNPGGVNTMIVRRLFTDWVYRLVWPFLWFLLKSPMQGAQTSIYCAVSKDLDKSHGGYFSDCIMKPVGKTAQDNGVRKKLWEVSERFVGLN